MTNVKQVICITNMAALVWLSCYSKIQFFECLINSRNLFLILGEAGRSRIKVLVDSVSGENPFPGWQAAIFLLGPHVAERARQLSGASFIRAVISMIYHVPKPHLLIPPPRGLRLQHMNFRWHDYSDYSNNLDTPSPPWLLEGSELINKKKHLPPLCYFHLPAKSFPAKWASNWSRENDGPGWFPSLLLTFHCWELITWLYLDIILDWAATVHTMEQGSWIFGGRLLTSAAARKEADHTSNHNT